jgi:hypothetical protein
LNRFTEVHPVRFQKSSTMLLNRTRFFIVYAV